MEADLVVIGACTVSAAFAYFVLVYQSGKGLDMPADQWPTRGSVAQWSRRSTGLERETLPE